MDLGKIFSLPKVINHELGGGSSYLRGQRGSSSPFFTHCDLHFFLLPLLNYGLVAFSSPRTHMTSVTTFFQVLAQGFNISTFILHASDHPRLHLEIIKRTGGPYFVQCACTCRHSGRTPSNICRERSSSRVHREDDDFSRRSERCFRPTRTITSGKIKRKRLFGSPESLSTLISISQVPQGRVPENIHLRDRMVVGKEGREKHPRHSPKHLELATRKTFPYLSGADRYYSSN